MKTFDDLEFIPRVMMGRQAVMFFPNGYGISVVVGDMFYGNYEAAVLKGTEKDSSLCYDTHIAADVIGLDDQEDVTNIMKQIQCLKLTETLNKLDMLSEEE